LFRRISVNPGARPNEARRGGFFRLGDCIDFKRHCHPLLTTIRHEADANEAGIIITQVEGSWMAAATKDVAITWPVISSLQMGGYSPKFNLVHRENRTAMRFETGQYQPRVA
jgi:hypothetical protein